MAYLTREQRRAKRDADAADAKKRALSRPERDDLKVRMKRALDRRKAANRAQFKRRTPAEREAAKVRMLDDLVRDKPGPSGREILGVPLRRSK